jgi:phosphonate transport system substrate-binding protein
MSDAPNAGSFSIGRVLLVVVPLALVAWAAKMYSGNLETDAKATLERTMVSRLLGDQHPAKLDKKYQDADGDLVADPPKDAAKALDPEEINLSYIAASDEEGEAKAWDEFAAALGERLKRKVNVKFYSDSGEQMRALEKGDLHVTAFSTGETQSAVNEAGFVPVACFADKDGKFAYTMKIIVPADSDIKEVKDLKGKRLAFVRPGSNSGCTAAIAMLMKELNLQPERDYEWGFTYGHKDSIEEVAAKRRDAAPVASDFLDRMIASGEVDKDSIRTIYESDPFPSGVIGYAHNLTPELREGIRETLLGFEWAGTGLEKTYGGSGYMKFAPVDYKKDWAPVREINKAGSEMFAKLDSSSI